MNTYLAYVIKAQFPRQIDTFLKEIKAEKYSEKSSTIKTEMLLDKIIWNFKRFIGDGFVVIIDSDGVEHRHPEADQKKLSRLDPDLDITVLRWKDEFLKSE
jgi:hypothetical protein